MGLNQDNPSFLKPHRLNTRCFTHVCSCYCVLKPAFNIHLKCGHPEWTLLPGTDPDDTACRRSIAFLCAAEISIQSEITHIPLHKKMGQFHGSSLLFEAYKGRPYTSSCSPVCFCFSSCTPYQLVQDCLYSDSWMSCFSWLLTAETYRDFLLTKFSAIMWGKVALRQSVTL